MAKTEVGFTCACLGAGARFMSVGSRREHQIRVHPAMGVDGRDEVKAYVMHSPLLGEVYFHPECAREAVKAGESATRMMVVRLDKDTPCVWCIDEEDGMPKMITA